jgi:hypothetical protein
MITPLYLPVQTVMLHFLQVMLYMTYSTSTSTMGHQKKDHTSITWSVTTTSTTSHIMKQVKCILMVTVCWCDHQYQGQTGHHKARNIPGRKVYGKPCSRMFFTDVLDTRHTSENHSATFYNKALTLHWAP